MEKGVLVIYDTVTSTLSQAMTELEGILPIVRINQSEDASKAPICLWCPTTCPGARKLFPII